MTASPATATPPPVEPSPTEPEARLGPVGTFVDKRVGGLQSRFLHVPQEPTAVAALARLRRAVSKDPGTIMDVLEFTFAPELLRGHPESDPNPSPAEYAAHVAITLFAAHQQSKGERMHRRGRGLGTAMRALHRGELRSSDPIPQRFKRLGTADSFSELTHHLRGVVQLLRSAGAPLDYGLLADQLLAWQRAPSPIRMTWGRQFYREKRADLDATDATQTTD